MFDANEIGTTLMAATAVMRFLATFERWLAAAVRLGAALTRLFSKTQKNSKRDLVPPVAFSTIYVNVVW